ncbi:MAG: DUF115 domain-containing protein [Gammaproteobacteria bacterium]|nr:DUF115 domain-containing protein [Gammaproteobacteria bacterium]
MTIKNDMHYPLSCAVNYIDSALPDSGDYRAVNMDIIARRWPNVLAYLSTPVASSSIEYITNTKQSTLCINAIHISSCYDRDEEVRVQAALLPDTASSVWLYGVGVGDLPRYIVKNTGLQEINVVLMSLSVCLASIQYFDQRDWLSDPRVTLYVPDDIEQLQVPFCTVPACLKLCDTVSMWLRDEIVLELNTPFINKKHHENKNHIINLNENINFIKNDNDVAVLFDRYASVPELEAFVIAAGPSLTDNLAVIKKIRGKASVLIVVDAALSVLRRAGITPDVVVSIDCALETIVRYFDFGGVPKTNIDSNDSVYADDESQYTNIPLVYFPVVYKEALLKWPGPRYVAYSSSSSIYQEVARQLPRTQLYSSGTVVHPAVDLAVKMGSKNIYFFGVDFSFPNGVSHVDGVSGAERMNETVCSSQVMNGYGHLVPSRPNMLAYLHDLERYIANHKTINFINMSRQGAVIKGTRYKNG